MLKSGVVEGLNKKCCVEMSPVVASYRLSENAAMFPSRITDRFSYSIIARITFKGLYFMIHFKTEKVIL